MARLIVTEYSSIDGVIQAPGGGEDFEHGGWVFEFDRGEGQTFKDEETFASEVQLLGRLTYDAFAPAWPTMEGDVADKFNAMPKYVVSKTLRDPEWNNTTVLSGDPIEETRALKDRVQGDIVVHGSARLARTLIEHDLVDELRLMVFPVVLGIGKRLFGDAVGKKPFKLSDSKVVGDGIVILTYQPAA